MKNLLKAVGLTAILLLIALNPAKSQSLTTIDLVVSLDAGERNFNYYFNFTVTDESGRIIFRTRNFEHYVNHPYTSWSSYTDYNSIRLTPGIYKIAFEVNTDRHSYQSRTDTILIEGSTLYNDGFYFVEFSEGAGFFWREVFFEDGNGNRTYFD